MAVIYMVHPTHGAKVACSDMEAAYDEQHGWSRYNLDAPSEEDEAPVAVSRRGRRKKDEPEGT
jgi:hypothetical protein